VPLDGEEKVCGDGCPNRWRKIAAGMTRSQIEEDRSQTGAGQESPTKLAAKSVASACSDESALAVGLFWRSTITG
jgi:hypothetical protein